MSPKKYGITPPITVQGSTDEERARNEALIKELRDQGSFEAEADTRRRVQVLEIMQRITKEFVYRVSIQKNMSDGMARDAGGKIFTFGSYRLGVYGPGSDIDTLVVVPKHVSREAFFDVMPTLLRERPELEELAPVPEAFMPIIKIKFGGISIDLICARLDLAEIPDSLLLDDSNLLKNIDERDQRALNGTRVTDAILNLVPERTTFKHALRAIKLWAQRRAIYANIMGFPGGVAWAMLVARVCQLYPNAVAAIIVDRFFFIYLHWPWPQPVLLTKIEDGPLPVRVWNPSLYPQDRNHKMPIITPAYPSMCATHNVTDSTKAIIEAELKRGHEITQGILAGTHTWADMFVKNTFFYDYKYYMCVYATTHGTTDEHLAWSGFVESRLRFLVQKLEVVPAIDIAHPFIKPFDLEFACRTDEEARAVADGHPLPHTPLSSATEVALEATAPEPKDPEESLAEEKKEAEEHPNIVRTTLLFLGLKLAPEQGSGKRTLDLGTQVQEFNDTLRNWASYNEKTYSLALRVLKPYDLPDCVFGEGEEKPRKAKKAKRAAGENGAKRAKIQN